MELPVFRHPDFLWLLLLLPVFFFSFRRRHSRSRGITVAVARGLIFAFLVVVLSQPNFRRSNDAVTTYFVLDHSGSIPEKLKTWSMNVVRQAVKEKRRKDRVGMVVFGDQAIIEESPTEHFEVDEIYSVVDNSNTDISAAVRLALSTFPDDTQKRIVLFTDGNETKGDLHAAVQRAAASGVPVDVRLLQYDYPDEVLMEGVSLPRKVQKNEPFQIRTSVRSLSANKGRLRIFSDGQLIAQRDVALRQGDNVFLFSHDLKSAGFHLFEAEVTAEKDGLSQNNRAQAYTIIEEESLVLLAGNSQEDVKHLAAALKEEGIQYRIRLAGQLPQDLGEWQSYDAIVFANLGAEHVSQAQMEMIESLVGDLGAGFIMVGGEHSFGAGGYMGTPIDKLLPVNLDIEQKKVLPNGGIAFIMDHIHCIGDRWSKDICNGTIDGLTRFDAFGLIVGGRSDWQIPLSRAEDKPELKARVNAARAHDTTDIDADIKRVIQSFKESRCSYRHTVLITDGNGEIIPDTASIAALRQANITLSIVLIEPRRGAPIGTLRARAKAGGGNFYVVQPHEYNRVPQIFIKESALVKKGLYYEEPFKPVMKDLSEILEGIRASEIPVLGGYCVTSKKEPTEVPLISDKDDAVLAHWQYRLGRSVAFTSDASSRWGKEWISWAKYRQFWSQAVRWCQRRMQSSPYQLTLQKGRKDGTCEAIIDAKDDKGRFVNFLSPQGILVTPELKPGELKFEQIGPGRYRAVFPVDRTGGYVVNVKYREKGEDYLLRGGYVPPYNPEYARFKDNEPLLLAAAEQTGGRLVAPGMNLFAPTGQAAYTSKPMWPILLLLAVCLFPLDVFVRRVIIGPRDILDMLRAVFPWLPGRRTARPDVLARERATVRSRSVFVPQYAAEGVSADSAPTVEAAKKKEGPPPIEIEMLNRLKQAKEEAKKKYKE